MTQGLQGTLKWPAGKAATSAGPRPPPFPARSAAPTSGKQAASSLPPARGALTVRGAVGDARPRVGWVGVVGVALRVQVVEEDVHLIGGQQLRRFHVVVRQARVVGVGVLRVQHRGVRHPARLLGRHLHGPPW